MKIVGIIGDDDMGELSKLPNIGKVVEEQLNQVGIFTEEELNSGGKEDPVIG